MNLIDTRFWPMWIAAALMLTAADFHYRTDRVPNLLTIPTIIAAWIVALLTALGLVSTAGGGIVSSLVSMVVGGLLLFPFYALGCLGAGCVKMQLGFGAWVGCTVDIAKGIKWTATSTAAGIIATTIGVVIIIAVSKLEKGEKRRRLFPAQITLSLGSVIGFLVVYYFSEIRTG